MDSPIKSNESSSQLLKEIENYVDLIDEKITKYRNKLKKDYENEINLLNIENSNLKKEKESFTKQITFLKNDKTDLIKIQDELKIQLDQSIKEDKDKIKRRKGTMTKTKLSKQISKRIITVNSKIEKLKKQIDTNNDLIEQNNKSIGPQFIKKQKNSKFENINKALQDRINEYQTELDLLEIILDMPGLQGKGCKPGFGINPGSGRCVKLTGKIGRKLIAQGLISNCNKDEILDTTKNKCINRNSPEGRKILSNIGLTESKSLLDKYYKQQKKLNSQVEIRVQEVEATLDMCQLKNREINTKIIDIKTQKKEVNKEYNEKNKELNKQLKN